MKKFLSIILCIYGMAQAATKYVAYHQQQIQTLRTVLEQKDVNRDIKNLVTIVVKNDVAVPQEDFKIFLDQTTPNEEKEKILRRSIKSSPNLQARTELTSYERPTLAPTLEKAKTAFAVRNEQTRCERLFAKRKALVHDNQQSSSQAPTSSNSELEKMLTKTQLIAYNNATSDAEKEIILNQSVTQNKSFSQKYGQSLGDYLIYENDQYDLRQEKLTTPKSLIVPGYQDRTARYKPKGSILPTQQLKTVLEEE